MENKKYQPEKVETKNVFGDTKRFREVFAVLQREKLDGQYQDAYEESARLAKTLIDTKNKSSWDEAEFVAEMGEKYPDISRDFIDALARCVKNYNPVVNIPEEPLWE